jgi:ribonuclease E
MEIDRMLDSEPTGGESAANPTTTSDSVAPPRRRRAASRAAGPPEPLTAEASPPEPAAADTSIAAPRPRVRRRSTKVSAETSAETPAETPAETSAEPERPRRRRRTAGVAAEADPAADGDAEQPPASEQTAAVEAVVQIPAAVPPIVTFQAPVLSFEPAVETATEPAPPRRRRRTVAAAEPELEVADAPQPDQPAASQQEAEADEDDGRPGRRRRRGRRGRGRGADGAEDGAESTATDGEPTDAAAATDEQPAADAGAVPSEDGSAGTRRRRRRRRGGGSEDSVEPAADDPPNTVVRVRQPRASQPRDADDEVKGVRGSTRLEARRQRRREGRDSGRRRPAVISESEFLARREAVDRVMVVRESPDRTQIAVLEDGVLVEHYVTRTTASSYVGNVYLGRVQNVLPSMEAAFVDIGKGRNAVLYAGEVNYDASSLDGRPQRIEQALKSGQSVLVQVTKDPIGSKGARLTSQVSLPGRYLVYVPDGSMTGISRKLPDTERARLKSVLKRVVPEDAGVIVRTAAEGAAEEELTRDVARLSAQWENISKRAGAASPPALLYAEPDLVVRVVRDLFNEDFAAMVVQGEDEWDTIEAYVDHVAPDLRERLSRWTEDGDVFAAYRVDEQLAKALDRKVWLPSGGSLVIDRTEAMIVIDVNTGKFTGSGGNLEETVTRNNLEAAEEIVGQLRLRDLGGIIVIDFIDMVLESNRDLVLRRLLECLGRDRTKHQVAEVTSLGLVQMTRKRVGQGLVEAFSEVCPECGGRGIKLTVDPFEEPAATRRRAVPMPVVMPGPVAVTPGPLVPAPVAPDPLVAEPASGAPEAPETEAPVEPAPAPRARTRRTATRKAGEPAPVPQPANASV